MFLESTVKCSNPKTKYYKNCRPWPLRPRAPRRQAPRREPARPREATGRASARPALPPALDRWSLVVAGLEHSHFQLCGRGEIPWLGTPTT